MHEDGAPARLSSGDNGALIDTATTTLGGSQRRPGGASLLALLHSQEQQLLDQLLSAHDGGAGVL